MKTGKHSVRKIISFALCLCLLLNFLPGMALQSHATGAEACSHAEYTQQGFCTQCGAYEAAALSQSGDYYDIANAGQLFWFADYVNNTDNSVGAKLLCDIDLNPGYSFHSDGTISYEGAAVTEGWRSWTPIGIGYTPYCGHFDGNGCTVSGVYCVEDSGSVGFFGYTDYNYIISELAIENSYFYGNENVGGLIGLAYTTVQNCLVDSTVTVTGASSAIGGLVGYNGGEISNCLALNGSVAGSAGYGSFSNCYFAAEAEDSFEGTTAVISEQLRYGEVAYLLQSGVQGEDLYDEETGEWLGTAEAELIWGQKLGTQSHPVLGGDRVYMGYGSCAEYEIGYTNSSTPVESQPDHSWSEGSCTVCGKNCSHGSYENNLCTVCGNPAPECKVLLSKNSVPAAAYTDVQQAINAVDSCTAADGAVLKLLSDISLGEDHLGIYSGVFTLDLGGFTLTSDLQHIGVVYIDSADAITVCNGRIIGKNSCLQMTNGTLNVENVCFEGGTGIYMDVGKVTVRDCSSVTLSNLLFVCGGTADVYGGSYKCNYIVYFNSGATAEVTFHENTVLVGEAVRVFSTTLNSILTPGMAFWEGNTMLLLSDDAKYVEAQELTIKPACNHENGTLVYTDNGEDHICSYSCCNYSYTEDHSYNQSGVCIMCGKSTENAEVLVSKNGTVIGAYEKLSDALSIAEGFTQEDQAVLKLLKDVSLVGETVSSFGGSFTLNLNGCTLSSDINSSGLFFINSDGSVTICNGTLIGNNNCIQIFTGTVTVENVKFGGSRAIYLHNGNVSVYNCSSDVSSTVFCLDEGTIDVYGGSYRGDAIADVSDSATLTLHDGTILCGEDIHVDSTSLNSLLAPGMAYWTENGMLILSDTVDQIDWQTATVKAACTHENGTKTYQQSDGSHICAYSCCNAGYTEPHSYNDVGLCSLCGAAIENAAVIVTKNGVNVGAYEDLQEAVNLAAAFTAADNAVLEIQKDVTFEASGLTISGGVYTVDLNQHKLTTSVDNIITVMVSSAAVVEFLNGEINGNGTSIYAQNASVTLDCVNMTCNYAVEAINSHVYLSYGTVTADTSAFILCASTLETDNSSFYGAINSIYCEDDAKVILNEYTLFCDGLEVIGTTLNAILAEGMAYWENDVMLTVDDTATGLGSGGYMVRKVCDHSSGEQEVSINANTHIITWSCCGSLIAEDVHTLGDDGCCTVCGFDPANALIIEMEDNYGDGWNGNAIRVLENGVEVAVLTLDEGYSGTTDYCFAEGADIELRWIAGNFAKECSFRVLLGGELVAEGSVDDCASYGEGYRIYPLCDHADVQCEVIPPTCIAEGYTSCYCSLCDSTYYIDYTSTEGHTPDGEGVVTPPTCTEQGYTTYTCLYCSEQFVDDYTPALGHAYDEDGKCSLCGFDPANALVIEMADSYGDGWNGNAIRVLENGVEVAILTLDEGYSGTTDYCFAEGADIELRWIASNFANECSFRVLLGGELVAVGSETDCMSYGDDYRIYPVCDHADAQCEVIPPTCTTEGYTSCYCSLCESTYYTDLTPTLAHIPDGEGVVTPPTCTEQGYTTYTCSVCGNSYKSDYVEPIDHVKGEGVVTPPTCTEQGYTAYTCTLCSQQFTDDYLPALGHVLGEDGNCTVCGERYSVLLTVAEVLVTVDNMDDILGDGTASYDPESNTLYLTDFVYVGTEDCICAEAGLNIVIEGENSITTDGHGMLFTPCNGEVTISGSGTLVMDVDDEGFQFEAVESAKLTIGGDLVIDINSNNDEGFHVTANEAILLLKDRVEITIGTEEVPVREEGVYVVGEAMGELIIENSVQLTAVTTDEEGIYVGGDSQTINISGTPVISVSAEEEGLDAATIHISGGSVTTYGGEDSYGINSEDLLITDSYVYADGDAAGIKSLNSLTIQNSIVVVKGSDKGISVLNEINLESCVLRVLSGGMVLGSYAGSTGSQPGELSLSEDLCIAEPANGTVSNSCTNADLPGEFTSIVDAQGAQADAFLITPVGWTKLAGNWYYVDPSDYAPKTGLSRVPYPTEPIAGHSYAADEEALAYCEQNGEEFIDAADAWFLFDETGVFLYETTGMDSYMGEIRWMEKGCLSWHPGLIDLDGEYYYFTGDSAFGGNRMATGDVYLSRNTTDLGLVSYGVYTFAVDGKLCRYEGIVELEGMLRYYEAWQWMQGLGLTKLGENYIYVRSNGEVVADAQYYVPANAHGVAPGLYDFDENGYLILPEVSEKDGVYFENDAWLYYEKGSIAYNKGMIYLKAVWHNGDLEEEKEGYVYVRSNGRLATGTYYITNVTNESSGQYYSGQRVVFDSMGIAEARKDGIVDVNGVLYFYRDDAIAYNAGLIEHNGGWIYVRSNGKLAIGAYWVTNTNGAMTEGMYEFGTDGYMLIAEEKDGIVQEGDTLYYYLDGRKQYGLGLVLLEDGSYIYVRSGGQLAVGDYWITNHNELLPEGMYHFNDNGLLIVD